MNLVDFEDPFSRRKIRGGLKEMLNNKRYTHAITLAPNRGEISLKSLEILFNRFCLDVDRFVFGRQAVIGIPKEQRFAAIAFPEKLKSNGHLHLVADLSERYLKRPFDAQAEAEMARIWKRICKSGTIHTSPRLDCGWSNYMTKDGIDKNSRYFLSTDFHPKRNMIQSYVLPFRWAA